MITDNCQILFSLQWVTDMQLTFNASDNFHFLIYNITSYLNFLSISMTAVIQCTLYAMQINFLHFFFGFCYKLKF